MTTSTAAASALSLKRQRAAWLLVGVIWGGYLLLRAVGAAGWIEHLAKSLLMPSLLLWVLVALGSAAPRWLVAGLLFATVGDIAILYIFEAGILGFLVMQICYTVGFLGLRAWGGLRRRWWPAVGYAALWLAVTVGLGPQFGELRIPVLVYSAAICTMAALATGVSTRVGLGAALFLISDLFLAFGEAGLDFGGRSAVVMPTYLAGQYLIATGWARRVDPTVVVPV